MRSSNPVLTRAFPDRAIGAPPPYFTAERMTIDDVVVHTAGLLGLVTLVAAITWFIVPNDLAGAIAMPAGLVALGLVLWTSFKRRGHVSPKMAIGYAVLEGVFVGAISEMFHVVYSTDTNGIAGSGVGGSIVLQALVATVAVFAGMLTLYRTGVLRATPKMRKILYTAVMGILVTYLASFVLRLFGAQMPLLNDTGPLGILISVAIVGVAAFMLILDFDQIESAIAAGAPREFAWTAAFGLMVTIIWLYMELLRLLSKLQSND